MKVDAVRRTLGVLLMSGTVLGGIQLQAAEKTAPAIATIEHMIGAKAEVVRGKYPAEMVAKGQTGFDGSYVETTAFRTGDEKLGVKLWESGPGALVVGGDGYPHDEYCLVLQGQVEITNEGGRTVKFGPGDTFVIPKGWRGTWDMKTRFRKQSIDLAPVAG